MADENRVPYIRVLHWIYSSTTGLYSDWSVCSCHGIDIWNNTILVFLLFHMPVIMLNRLFRLPQIKSRVYSNRSFWTPRLHRFPAISVWLHGFWSRDFNTVNRHFIIFYINLTSNIHIIIMHTGVSEWGSEWLLLYANSASVQLYHDKN
jgi:hypothetical protein